MRPQWSVWTPSERLCVCPLPYLFIPVALGTNSQVVLSSVLALKPPSTLAGVASSKAFLPVCTDCDLGF